MLKKMGFRQQIIIKSNNIKRFDHCADRKKPKKELQKGKSMFHAIQTTNNKQA